MKSRIVPTILTPDFAEFKERLKQVAPFFKLVQLDCADGKFVSNKTFYDVRKVNEVIKVNYELHLMVSEPLREIKKWLGCKKLKTVIFHGEAVKADETIIEIIKFLHKKGIRAGLAINPETKIEKVVKFLPLMDVLLIMGVKPGRGGQKFQPKVLAKIKQARKLFPKLNIEVDGGVNLQNTKEIIKAGANILAIGKALSADSSIKQFKKLI